MIIKTTTICCNQRLTRQLFSEHAWISKFGVCFYKWNINFTNLLHLFLINYNRLDSAILALKISSAKHFDDVIMGAIASQKHQPHECVLNRLFKRRSKKTSKLRVTGLCAGNSAGNGEFPAQMASNAENVFPFDDVIMTLLCMRRSRTQTIKYISRHCYLYPSLTIWLCNHGETVLFFRFKALLAYVSHSHIFHSWSHVSRIVPKWQVDDFCHGFRQWLVRCSK